MTSHIVHSSSFSCFQKVFKKKKVYRTYQSELHEPKPASSATHQSQRHQQIREKAKDPNQDKSQSQSQPDDQPRA